MNFLIGISGKPRSGKDTIANRLQKEHGFYKYAFADYLKWIAVEYFGYNSSELWGDKTEESRKFLQDLGKYCTDTNSSIFVNNTVEKIKEDYLKCEKEGKHFRVVISDVRREEELVIFDRDSTIFIAFDKILNSGVSMKNIFDKILIVKVERPIEAILKEEPGLEENINHPIEQFTETHTEWDYLIPNNGSKLELLSYVDRLVSELKEEHTNDSDKGKDI